MQNDEDILPTRLILRNNFLFPVFLTGYSLFFVLTNNKVDLYCSQGHLMFINYKHEWYEPPGENYQQINH